MCGEVKFSVDGFSDEVANCYCSMCRKFHGAAFGTVVKVYGLTWCSGTESLKNYIAPNGTVRTFCFNCSSSLGFKSNPSDHDNREIAISTFDVEIPVKINAQIYTSSKPSWTEIHYNIPVYKEGRY